MEYQAVEKIVDGIPYITKNNSQFIYNFIIENNIKSILELGVAHGVATCYMAAALKKSGGGKITAVDLKSSKINYTPTCEDLLEKCNLKDFVDIKLMDTGYNWFLHDDIKNSTTNNNCIEKYDLCIIDGPKNWTTDSSAFFLVDKLLKKNGYIIFDDYSWIYEDYIKNNPDTAGKNYANLSDSERTTPHIQEVFNLLVKQHSNYSEFKVFDDKQWAMAKKTLANKKTEIKNFSYYNSKNLLHTSRLISKLIEKIEELNSTSKKYIVYGYGSTGKIIHSIFNDKKLTFIDKNHLSINKKNVISPNDLLNHEFDYIIISLLGRENEVITFLKEECFISNDKIICLL